MNSLNPSKSKEHLSIQSFKNGKRKRPSGGFEFEKSMLLKRAKLFEENISEEPLWPM